MGSLKLGGLLYKALWSNGVGSHETDQEVAIPGGGVEREMLLAEV